MWIAGLRFTWVAKTPRENRNGTWKPLFVFRRSLQDPTFGDSTKLPFFVAFLLFFKSTKRLSTAKAKNVTPAKLDESTSSRAVKLKLLQLARLDDRPSQTDLTS